MTSNLPEPHDATPAVLGGQAALFDDPRLILQWDDAFLRSVAANIGKEGGSILAQLRRAAGLVAWAAWHRFDDKTCEAFLRGIADNLGVSVRTVREWRKAVIDKETLPIPALAAARSDEALKRNKPAGQGRRITTPSTKPEPILADSTETPIPSSGGARTTAPPIQTETPTGEVANSPGPAPLDPDEIIERDFGGTVLRGPRKYIDECKLIPLPERPPSIRQLAARVVAAMQEVDPTDAGPALTPEEATFLRQWAQRTLDAWKAVYAPPAPAEKPQRRQGTITRPNGHAFASPPNGMVPKGKRHALDCSCLGCKPAKAAAK